MTKPFVANQSTSDYALAAVPGESRGARDDQGILTDKQRSASPNRPISSLREVRRRYSTVLTHVWRRPQRPVIRKIAARLRLFGLTRDDIAQDVREGVTTRIKAVLEKARSPAARCRQMAANGQPCIAYVQKCYMQCLREV